MKLYKNIIKRLFDFLTALTGLLIISPLLLVLIIILAIQNNGKPFFYQARTGENGKIFTIIKFKTMTDKTDKDGELLPPQDRITKAGDICRRYSLDEIPQLINILKGDMSLVGPRPLLPKYLERYTIKQTRRHEVIPGITGWAQVNGRNAISWEQKFELDVYYVNNQSFLLDIKIILKTIDKVVNRKDVNSSNDAQMEEFMGSSN
ncbi:sugar transferase [Winogradskyella sp. UBA3174]|uniref:sugar transferase n=1 Tax=Winogradskyella sp. UBA3174 TaxID=1947785 RepID=UPI0025DD1BFD|nr:sugar transferase [Winogradskyella sp. UBA3174]|tara:strand:- start:42582 stop:43196 length:615 start_codon:yes stop_codon:yes gene_type:complete